MTQVRKIFLPLHAMFVRFRQSRNQLQLSLLETRRVAGKVVQGHVASLGSIIVPPAIADRVAFWQKLHERLARLSDRIDAEAQGKILDAVHSRAPMVTIEEIRALQLENAEADERFWSQLQDITYSGRAPTLDDSNWRHPLAPDSLFQIAWAIQRRERPRLEDLIAALERDERVIWPKGVLPYVARLIAGKPVPNEPSPWPEEKKIYEAYYLVRRVKRWGEYFRNRKKLRAWRKAALEKVAKERDWSWNNIEKEYKKAKRLLRTVRIAATDWKLKRIIAGYREVPLSRGIRKI